VPMDSWTPPAVGEYIVKAFFSRNPDDQNPVNDRVEFYLRVNASRAILLTGGNVVSDDLAKAISVLKEKGMAVDVMNTRTADLSAVKNTNVFFMGTMDDAGKNAIATAVQNGNDVAAIYGSDLKLGTLLQNIDFVFDIDRGNVDYSNIDLNLPPMAVKNEKPVDVSNVQIASKEDLVKFIRSAARGVETVAPVAQDNAPAVTTTSTVAPDPIRSAYGDVRFQYEQHNGVGITYIVPAIRKPVNNLAATTPAGFSLAQNYPNPFNPSTMISFTLPEASHVTLRILDMLGRDVMTLVNGNQQAGMFTASWKGLDNNGVAVASGTYMYRIDAVPVSGAQPFSATRKMTLSK
jgi:hypothetical protein